MKRLLLVSTISLFSASVYAVKTTKNRSSQFLTPTYAMNQSNKRLLQISQLAEYNRCTRIINRAPLHLTTGIKMREEDKKTVVNFVKTPTKPCFNSPYTPDSKHLVSLKNASTIATMSNGTITVKRFSRKNSTTKKTRTLSNVLTTPCQPQTRPTATPPAAMIKPIPTIMITTVASPDKNQQTTHLISAKKTSQ